MKLSARGPTSGSSFEMCFQALAVASAFCRCEFECAYFTTESEWRICVVVSLQYLEQKRYEDAYRAWRNATRQRPTHLVSWNNLVLMLDQRGHASDAERAALQALRHLPHEPALHFQLANILGKAGKYQRSEQHFLAAIRLKLDNPSYHTNLGKLLLNSRWHGGTFLMHYFWLSEHLRTPYILNLKEYFCTPYAKSFNQFTQDICGKHIWDVLIVYWVLTMALFIV